MDIRVIFNPLCTVKAAYNRILRDLNILVSYFAQDSGSIISAGVLLRLGGYGLICVIVFLVNFSFNLIFFLEGGPISLLGGFYI